MTNAARLRCSACGKTFRVPDPARTYRCKSCGGALGPASDEAAAPAAESARVASARGGARTSRAGRSEAGLELLRARRTIKIARFLFSVAAALAILIFVGSSYGLWWTVKETPRVPLDWGAYGLVLALSFLASALFLAGTLFVGRQPFLWTALLASLTTLWSLAVILSGTVPLIPLLIAVGLWVWTPPTMRVRRLTRMHPDLYAARLLAHEKPAWRSPVPLLGAASMLVGIVLLVMARLAQPQPTARVAERFRDDWNEHGAKGVGTWTGAEHERELTDSLRAGARTRGWEDGLPRLGDFVEDLDGSNGMWLSFTSDEGDVTTRWQLDGGDWRLAQVMLPIEHVLEGFTEAWNRSDLDGVVAFCPEGSRMADALRRLIERRGWAGRFPPLEGYDGEVRDYGRASVTHMSAEGVPLRTRWHFTDGRWLLAALDPPE